MVDLCFLSISSEVKGLYIHSYTLPPPPPHTHTHAQTSSSSDSSDDIIPVQGYDGTTPLTLDEDYQDPDTLEFQASLEEVKAIVGSDASEEVLKELLMQADMDVNRAINFYYNID